MAVQHTMVPYLWRRHLGIVRTVLAGLCVLLYILKPVPGGAWIAVIAALYAAYSVLTLIRDTVESNLYPVSMLILDGVFFLLCALHPSEPGLWLSTIAYFYVVSFSALLYEWWHVFGVVADVGRLLRDCATCPDHLALAGSGAWRRARDRAFASQTLLSGPALGCIEEIGDLKVRG